MNLTRRRLLRGVGGISLGLPFLESFSPVEAAATDRSFAIFLRQANGVACASPNTAVGSEPERFWPTQTGALSAPTVAGRALEELSPYLNRLLVARVDTPDYKFNCGHARGAFQGLTANGPLEEGLAERSEAKSESIDHRIGRELNPGGRDSIYLYAGQPNGFLGGPCISHRGPGQRRSAISNPWTAYQSITGGAIPAGMPTDRVGRRQKSVNDFVREELKELISNPVLSLADKKRLDLHLSSIRDLEVALGCALATDQAKLIETGSGVFESNNGEDRILTVGLHLDVVALAVACGQTRSAAVQVGSGTDPTQYRDPVTGALYENFHYVSHRVQTDDSKGPLIAGSDIQHSNIDRYFAKMFKHLLDKLDAYPMPTGGTLLDAGVSIWYNELGNGPGHSPKNVPYVIAGGVSGTLKQGQYVDASGNESSHCKLLRAIGVAVGVKTPNGAPLDDFGDPTAEKGYLDAVFV